MCVCGTCTTDSKIKLLTVLRTYLLGAIVACVTWLILLCWQVATFSLSISHTRCSSYHFVEVVCRWSVYRRTMTKQQIKPVSQLMCEWCPRRTNSSSDYTSIICYFFCVFIATFFQSFPHLWYFFLLYLLADWRRHVDVRQTNQSAPR